MYCLNVPLLHCKHVLIGSIRSRGLHTERLKKALIEVKGRERHELLQGLITNDINHLHNHKPAIYSHFLNRTGRVIHDVIIYNDRVDTDACLIECDEHVGGNLLKHLKMYKLRKKADLLDVTDKYNVHVVHGKDSDAVLTEAPELSTEVRSFVSDPRLKCLGLRVVLEKSSSVKKFVSCEESAGLYSKLRYELGVAEGSDEIPVGKCFPLEYNCDYLNGVSFQKGCYIGQELTARSNYTGVIRKRIMGLTFTGEAAVEDSIVNQAGKSVGKVRAVSGGCGLGLMRIEQTLKAESLTVNGASLTVTTPHWWPRDIKY